MAAYPAFKAIASEPRFQAVMRHVDPALNPATRVSSAVRLIRPQVALIELARRCAKIRANRSTAWISIEPCSWRSYAREFLQHRLSEMGHRNLLLTHALPGWPSKDHV